MLSRTLLLTAGVACLQIAATLTGCGLPLPEDHRGRHLNSEEVREILTAENPLMFCITTDTHEVDVADLEDPRSFQRLICHGLLPIQPTDSEGLQTDCDIGLHIALHGGKNVLVIHVVGSEQEVQVVIDSVMGIQSYTGGNYEILREITALVNKLGRERVSDYRFRVFRGSKGN